MGNIKTDMQQVFTVLNKEKLCMDKYHYIKGNTFNIEKLKLNINDVPRGTKPNVRLLSIVFSICFQFDKNGIYPDKYNFCFETTAYNGEEQHKASWHFDFDTTLSTEFIHPFFHLTYGGKSMDDMDLGKTLLLPTPRIAYPPMDFILGVDFILSNFLSANRYKNIRAKNEYVSAVKNSQERLWKPYIQTIANHWDKKVVLPSNYFKSIELIPTLC